MSKKKKKIINGEKMVFNELQLLFLFVNLRNFVIEYFINNKRDTNDKWADQDSFEAKSINTFILKLQMKNSWK